MLLVPDHQINPVHQCCCFTINFNIILKSTIVISNTKINANFFTFSERCYREFQSFWDVTQSRRLVSGSQRFGFPAFRRNMSLSSSRVLGSSPETWGTSYPAKQRQKPKYWNHIAVYTYNVLLLYTLIYSKTQATCLLPVLHHYRLQVGRQIMFRATAVQFLHVIRNKSHEWRSTFLEILTTPNFRTLRSAAPLSHF